MGSSSTGKMQSQHCGLHGHEAQSNLDLEDTGGLSSTVLETEKESAHAQGVPAARSLHCGFLVHSPSPSPQQPLPPQSPEYILSPPPLGSLQVVQCVDHPSAPASLTRPILLQLHPTLPTSGCESGTGNAQSKPQDGVLAQYPGACLRTEWSCSLQLSSIKEYRTRSRRAEQQSV